MKGLKLIVTIFNFVFLAFAAVAMVTLLTMPTLKLNVGYTMTADQISESVPKSDEVEVDVKELIGGDSISVDLSLTVSSKLLFKSVSGDPKKAIDEEFVDPNVANVAEALKKPINQISRGTLKMTASQIMIKNFETSIDQAKQPSDSRSATQIRKQAGIDDDYFNDLAEDILQEMEKTNSTVTKVNNIMFNGLSNAIKKLNKANVGIMIPEPDQSYKDDVRDDTRDMLTQLQMVKEDGESLYSLSIVMDATMVDVLRSSNNEEAPKNETLQQKAAKLDSYMSDFVKDMIPAEAYDIIASVLKIVLYVVIAIVAVWGFFFLWTLIRTILGIFGKDKCWTFTGPLFWIVGFFQILLGVALTTAVSVFMSSGMLETMASNTGSAEAAEAVGGISFSIYTSMFIPSIFLLIMIPTCIAYGIIKGKYKRQVKNKVPEQQ